jgi:hypothetical protein
VLLALSDTIPPMMENKFLPEDPALSAKVAQFSLSL